MRQHKLDKWFKVKSPREGKFCAENSLEAEKLGDNTTEPVLLGLKLLSQ